MRGILFVHGFVSWNKDWDFLVEKLQDQGFIIERPNLKGHKELSWKNTTHKDWINDVEQAYERLSKQCDEIFLVGHSMGCVLLTRLMDKHKDDKKIKRVMFFNPAFKHTNFKNCFFRVPVIAYEYMFVILREHNLKRSFKRLFTPYRIIKELYAISSASIDLIPNIEKDILFIQGVRDGLVVKKNVLMAYNKVSSKHKDFRIRNYGHIPYAAGKNTKQQLYIDLIQFINHGV